MQSVLEPCCGARQGGDSGAADCQTIKKEKSNMMKFQYNNIIKAPESVDTSKFVSVVF